MSDTVTKIIETGEVQAIVETATKPVLEVLEAAVLRALGAVNRTIKMEDSPETAKLHIEASIYEEAAMVCAQRVVQIAATLREKGDDNRADILHLSLASGLREIGVLTGGAHEPQKA